MKHAVFLGITEWLEKIRRRMVRHPLRQKILQHWKTFRQARPIGNSGCKEGLDFTSHARSCRVDILDHGTYPNLRLFNLPCPVTLIDKIQNFPVKTIPYQNWCLKTQVSVSWPYHERRSRFVSESTRAACQCAKRIIRTRGSAPISTAFRAPGLRPPGLGWAR